MTYDRFNFGERSKSKFGNSFWGIKLQPFFFLFKSFPSALILFLGFVSAYICLCSLVLCLSNVYKHARLLELGFSFVLYFSVLCFWVRVCEQAHARMPWACVCRLNLHTQAFGRVRRHLSRNPSSDFLFCLVYLFHMFCLRLNPFYMFKCIRVSVLYAYLSLICLDYGFMFMSCLNTMNMHSHVHAQCHRC